MERTISVRQNVFRNRFIERFKVLMELCHDTFLTFSVIFLFVNIYSAMSNGGITTNNFNKFGEMNLEAVLLSLLLGMTLGHRLVISKNRRKSMLFGVLIGVMLVIVVIVMKLTSGVID